MRKAGCIEAVEYFVNGADPSHPPGYVILSPYSGCRPLPGYCVESAETLAQVDKLEKKLQEQEYEAAEREGIRDDALLAPRRDAMRDRLYQRMISSSTDQYEKDFLREYLKLREDHPKKAFYRNHLECYLYARHFDVGKRSADNEQFNVDRIEVK